VRVDGHDIEETHQATVQRDLAVGERLASGALQAEGLMAYRGRFKALRMAQDLFLRRSPLFTHQRGVRVRG
jgi:hypothetical protein